MYKAVVEATIEARNSLSTLREVLNKDKNKETNMSCSLEAIVTYVNGEIAKLEAELVKGNKYRETEDEYFYPFGMDIHGIPHSFGNANDVYDDGYGWGEKQGKLSELRKLAEMFGKSVG